MVSCVHHDIHSGFTPELLETGFVGMRAVNILESNCGLDERGFKEILFVRWD